MAVTISLLRGVNVGGHNRIKMEELRALYAALKLRDARTYVQSGNVVFRSEESETTRLAERIARAIERQCGFRPGVIVRTCGELREAIARNPFAGRPEIEPAKLLVVFLAAEPSREAREKLRRLDTAPEEVRLVGRELYIYYVNGMARPKVPWTALEKLLQVSGTGRNWNTVTKLLEIADAMTA